MMKWLQKQLDKIGSPELDWVQVEVTTHCNSACVYCPRDRLALHWENTHMSLETFSKLMPFLNYTQLIYLQGWGEPLLNPHLLR